MSELTALESAGCPACGAQATWSPSREALVCPYCGTEAPGRVNPETGTVEEIDLVTALRSLPDDRRGFDTPTRSVKCRRCRAVSVFDPARVGQRCSFCGAPELVDYEEIRSPVRPQGVVPFRVDEAKARELLGGWFRSKWFAPGSLAKRGLVDTVTGIYVPYWTFDAKADARWSADAGTYFYTSETVRGPDGRPRRRQVRHTRWRPASGAFAHAFDDEPIPGTRGIRQDHLRAIQPFPTGEAVPYDTAYLSGFIVEHYQVVLIDAARHAREAMEAKLRALAAAEVPGDTYRNLRVEADFAAETFKHVLVPVWVLIYDHDRGRHQVLVNGHSGEIAGEYPKSPIKIALAVAGVVIVVGIILALSR